MSGESGDTQRTDLAAERTMLAWWRTGLASLAVALAVGRLLPELSRGAATWPFVALGLGFSFYGTAMIVYGTLGATDPRRLRWDRTLAMAFGVILALGTSALILFQ